MDEFRKILDVLGEANAHDAEALAIMLQEKLERMMRMHASVVEQTELLLAALEHMRK